MHNRKIMTLIILIVSFLFQFEIKADYFRVCKYEDINTKDEVTLYWGKSSAQLIAKDGTPIKDVNTSLSFQSYYIENWYHVNGCPTYINDFQDYLHMSGSYNSEYTKYKFKEAILAGETITSNLTCEYQVENGETVTLTIDKNGKITNNKGSSIKNEFEVVKIFDTQNRCPVSLCYDKEIGQDHLNFSDDIDYKCPWWWVNAHNNTEEDRQQKLNSSFGNDLSEEQELEAQIIITEYNRVLDAYASCFDIVDEFKQKCTALYNSMNNICSSGDDEECVGAQTNYKKCIENNYTQDEIEAYCSTKRKDYELAKDQVENFENRTGTKLGIDLSTTEEADCGDLLGNELIDWFKNAFFIIQVGAIIYTIIATIFGYAGAVISSDEDAIKNVHKKFKTRLFILAFLILLPILIEFVLGLTDVPGLTNKDPFCE